MAPGGFKNKFSRWNFRAATSWLPDWEAVGPLLILAFFVSALLAVCQLVTGWPSWGFWGLAGFGIIFVAFVLLAFFAVIVVLLCYLPFMMWSDGRLLFRRLKDLSPAPKSEARELLSVIQKQPAVTIVIRWMAMPLAAFSALGFAALVSRRVLWPPFDFGRRENDDELWMFAIIASAVGGFAFVAVVRSVSPFAKSASCLVMTAALAVLAIVGIGIVWFLGDATADTSLLRTLCLLASVIAAMRTAAALEQRDVRHRAMYGDC